MVAGTPRGVLVHQSASLGSRRISIEETRRRCSGGGISILRRDLAHLRAPELHDLARRICTLTRGDAARHALYGMARESRAMGVPSISEIGIATAHDSQSSSWASNEISALRTFDTGHPDFALATSSAN